MDVISMGISENDSHERKRPTIVIPSEKLHTETNISINGTS